MVIRFIKNYVNFQIGQKIGCDVKTGQDFIKNGFAIDEKDYIENVEPLNIENSIDENIEIVEPLNIENPIVEIKDENPIKPLKKKKK